MVLLEMATMFWCFVFRLLFQFFRSEDISIMKSIRMIRVFPWILSLPLLTIFYLTDIFNYIAFWIPGTWAMQPMPVTYFLAWIIILVTDSLYQFHMISKLPESNAQ